MRGINRLTCGTFIKYLFGATDFKVGRPILLVFPLYYAHRLDTERLIEIDIIIWSVRTTSVADQLGL